MTEATDPWFWGGANKPDLHEAQKNYESFGAVEKRLLVYVEDPAVLGVKKDPIWRRVKKCDREYRTSPRAIEEALSIGESIPYEYWKRDFA